MTSYKLVSEALEKIESLDRNGYKLNSVIAIAEDAISQAIEFDNKCHEMKQEFLLGGIPILIKDNIECVGLPCCAGSLALLNSPVNRDCSLVKRLKDAGAIIIGSTNLSEWANIRSTKSTSGWSAAGGLTKNPWKHDRSAGGSSSGCGAAVAANLVRFAVGSETDGSITCPASLNGCVGIKPTVNSIPKDGMIPISNSQDSPGPMTQTVKDCALLLGVLQDKKGYVEVIENYKGLRIGFVKNWITKDSQTNEIYFKAIEKLRGIPDISLIEISLPEPSQEVHDDELKVLLHELYSDMEKYLKSRFDTKCHSLADIVDFNIKNQSVELEFFNQDLFDESLKLGGRKDSYSKIRDRNVEWAKSIFNVGFANCDVLIGCLYGPAWVSTLGLGDIVDASWMTLASSILGAPIGSIPMGLVNNLPVGLGFTAPLNREDNLLKVMFAAETALNIGVMSPIFDQSN